MSNVVDIVSGRSRPRRIVKVGDGGAQILLFTGVRYERFEEDEAPAFVPEHEDFEGAAPTPSVDGSVAAFELATR